ncbi:5-formyltetrahydrofolate cyclo-ligase [Allobranchiibius sp. GilTou73]|uniref:5-formyltetrahydrofolate cyclo-ligase n=1 Tax=Allobranchiibius sp. GilTou73 TaxID=2904523 RepID=UPI001F422853|nr:5-formyltetrahydrofolate cyclo-ligase [Allobranchiibius sp. GilTou73]UIJ34889.1 ligase [Allobranchiibius sp. GilTou73]
MWRELPQDKRAARALIRSGRRARPAQERSEDDAALAGHLRDLLGDRLPGLAATYSALPTEPPTRAMRTLLEQAGWRVMAPILLPDNDLGWDDGNAHDPSFVSEATLLIVPALAVDRRGMRLGQGGGSYDRSLHRRSPGSLALAVVYDDELADVVPSEPHDLAVDAVLTPRAGVRHLTE